MAAAWWDRGHLLTARIAHYILEEGDPSTYNAIINILQPLRENDPEWTVSEGDHMFTECATFADVIKKYHGGQYQRGWHFIDEPYLDQGGNIKDFDFTFDTHNVTEVIAALNLWFNKTDGYQNTYEYQQIMNRTYKEHTEKIGMSTAMRFLIHYTGDVHQPLHATTRVDKKYPRGDFGGNTVPLPSVKGADNLHAVWDSVGYEYTGFEDLPFRDGEWQNITNIALGLMEKYKVGVNISDAEINNLDPKLWAHESFELSQEFVYPGVEPNVALSHEYIANCRAVAERQIVKGGYRLANTLSSFRFNETLQADGTLKNESTQRKSLFYSLLAKFIEAI